MHLINPGTDSAEKTWKTNLKEFQDEKWNVLIYTEFVKWRSTHIRSNKKRKPKM